MSRSLAGIAVFICVLLATSAVFAGGRTELRRRARLDHYARPIPNQGRVHQTRARTHTKYRNTRVQRSTAHKPRAIRRLRNTARFMDNYNSRRVVRTVRRPTSRTHVKGPARLSRPPQLLNKIRCAELEDKCLPSQATRSAAQRTSSKASRTKKVQEPARLRMKRDSVVRCPDGDCSL